MHNEIQSIDMTQISIDFAKMWNVKTIQYNTIQTKQAIKHV